ncbi:short chain dehydrogenase [compost metagenome]
MHVGYMETDMTSSVDAPKSNPAEIAKVAIDGIESGSFEILADDPSRMMQRALAGGVAAIYPNLK